jgi:Glycosyl transferase family 2
MPFQSVSAEDRALVQSSGLFDAQWYLRSYPDVGISEYEPLTHFLTYGTLLLRDPGPEFSSRFYSHLHGKAALSGGNALLHRLKNPKAKGHGENVLLGAHDLAVLGRCNLALALAHRHMPQDLLPTLASLKMAEALQQGDLARWLAALNGYLASYGQSALCCDSFGDDVFSQIRATAQTTVSDGPLISVLMPVFNAAQTLGYAVDSILGQSWRNLELLVVDDASQDDSWPRLQAIAARDPRLKLMRTTRNVGPYVAKTLALRAARGAYITGHDSDDWAHPHRLERHMAAHQAQSTALPLSLTWGLRLGPDGAPTHISQARTDLSQDGFVRRVPVSCLFEAAFLHQRLGAWDSVRFGADTELLMRAEHQLGVRLRELPVIGMLCRDAPGSLSNDALHGTRLQGNRLSPTRRDYLAAIRRWLQSQPASLAPALPLPHSPRHYPAPAIMLVPDDDIRHVLEHQNWL